LQDGIAVIGRRMFAGCKGLTTFTIPSSVTSIGALAFVGCTNLHSIIAEPGNPQFASNDGVLFDASQTVLIQYPPGRTGAYSIPPGVSRIGTQAFYGCSGLTAVLLHSSVGAIDEEAFYGCGLTGITLPHGVTSLSQGSFKSCYRLTSLFIPSSVTSIGNEAFEGCVGLTRVLIPPSVTVIGNDAFASCRGLTNVTIPSSVTSMGEDAFFGCQGLVSVTIVMSGNGASIGPSAFARCTGLTRAVFLGDAPSMGETVFTGTVSGFIVYYLSGRSGFTSPTWAPSPLNSYRSVMIDEANFPAASWLLKHDLWYDTSLHQDPDGDGVPLLMAYALNLDPRHNVRSSLPVPMSNGDKLSLNFHATSPGVTYRVETSTDLQAWTTSGVTQSAPGPDQRSTATIPFDGPSRFLRLTVED
jgi:hypothetical protein